MDEMAEPQSDLRYGADDVDAAVGIKDDIGAVVNVAIVKEDGIDIAKT